MMDSYIDVASHVVFSLLTGYITWKLFALGDRKSLLFCLAFAFLGGVLIDLDHFIDHFLTFGLNFNYDYFIKGEYFLKSNKAYIVFHGFEYVMLFGVLALFAKARMRKTIFIAITLAMLSHLLIDTFLFPNPIKGYFILYRILQGFKVDMSGGVLD